MIILDAATKSLKIVLAGNVTANQLQVTTHYTDITTTAYTPGSTDTVTNNTTAVEIVAAPAASTQRHVETISVHNADTASSTVSIQYVSAGGTRLILKALLLTLENLIYEDGTGWQSIDANGNVKMTTLTWAIKTAADVDCSGTTKNLTPTECLRTVLHNNGQTGTATTTLPAASEGLSFIAVVSTKVAQNWIIQRNGAETLYVDYAGSLSSGKVSITCNNQEIGSRLSAVTFKTSASTWAWVIGIIRGTFTVA
jgi:hypothetical protein